MRQKMTYYISSLCDNRLASVNQGRTYGAYNYSTRTGRPRIDKTVHGVPMTNEVIGQFAEFLNDYKKGRERTFEYAYASLIEKYYTSYTPDGSSIRKPLSECPTFNQFYHYCKTHITQEEMDVIKTSRQEQRNAKRVLVGSSRTDAIRPGWILESDAVEADFSIVSELDAEQSIGRPIVYFAVDVYSSVIVAISASFENNSILGLTNLFMNLADDKQEFARKYNMEIDPSVWPSGFIPNEIRCDRGSDFKSDKFREICRRLGINRTLETGGTGSMKGIVEQSFHQFQSSQRPEMESKGLITKRYDSNHHREAMIDLNTFTRMLISFVVTHNQKVIIDYPMERDMYKQKGFKPTPVSIWEYGTKKYGMPKMISAASRTQYYFDLMQEKTASISRRGIVLNGLVYEVTTRELISRCYALGAKREDITVRYDPRDVSNLYLLESNQLIALPLQPLIPGNADFGGMAWKQYEEYHKVRKQLRREGAEFNRIAMGHLYRAYGVLVAENKRPNLSTTDGIREARETEKQLKNQQNRIVDHMQEPAKKISELPAVHSETLPTSSVVDNVSTPVDSKDLYSAWKQSLEEDW